ncbi:MAG TPA: hypothetical protein VLL76_10335, partial [Candidatus Omnitrophota bacterium]|nr:hypothetical protein [Candidatus Omnitrophota bacterium]
MAHYIVITPLLRPGGKTLAPGTPVELSDDQGEKLERSGAVAKVVDGSAVPVPGTVGDHVVGEIAVILAGVEGLPKGRTIVAAVEWLVDTLAARTIELAEIK